MFFRSLPPGYSLWRFPSQKSHEDFAQFTGHGSMFQVLGDGVAVAIYDECRPKHEDGCTEVASWAAFYGAKRMRKQPKLTPIKG